MLARLEHDLPFSLGSQGALDGIEHICRRQGELVDVARREEADVDALGDARQRNGA
jgi:hypothetical protein